MRFTVGRSPFYNRMPSVKANKINASHLLNRYSYGKKISGGFHCRFGVKGENKNGAHDIMFIKGLGKTGPVSKNIFTL